MSFFCPHFDQAKDTCQKLKCECVPGRPGCVLRGKVAFLVPAEERLKTRGRKGDKPTRSAPRVGG